MKSHMYIYSHKKQKTSLLGSLDSSLCALERSGTAEMHNVTSAWKKQLCCCRCAVTSSLSLVCQIGSQQGISEQ